METLYPLSSLATIVVSTETGATVYLIDAKGKRHDAAEANGTWTFEKLSKGTCTIYAVKYGATFTKQQYVEKSNTYQVSITIQITPEFTYSGSYKLVNDSDTEISASEWPSYRGNWKIRFLTSGTFNITNMNAFAGKIDVFLVGGGGGGGSHGKYKNGSGGGGGYTTTLRSISVEKGTSYSVTIGSGGAINSRGGTSSAFNGTAAGGYGCPSEKTGGAGGSGGGAWQCAGGSDGGNGGSGENPKVGGNGQGTTTREFGESTGKLYAGGGGGGQSGGNGIAGGAGGGARGGYSALDNTGGGGGGQNYSYANYGGAGGSGIVVIRNAR